MLYVLLLREEAEHYRELASKASDPRQEEECKDLAAVLDEVASDIEEKIGAG